MPDSSIRKGLASVVSNLSIGKGLASVMLTGIGLIFLASLVHEAAVTALFFGFLGFLGGYLGRKFSQS